MVLQTKSTSEPFELTPVASSKIPRRGMPVLHDPDPKFVKLFDGWLKKHFASGGVTTRFHFTQPNLEFENFCLTRNIKLNRKLKERQLDEMVLFRQSGRDFLNYNDCICFNTDGGLETGQHRCIAGIRSGLGSRHDVMIGPPGYALEQWATPSDSKDRWRRHGFDSNHKLRKAIIRLLLAVENGTLSAYNRTEYHVYLRSTELNGTQLFEDAISFTAGRNALPFSSNTTFSLAYLLIGASTEGKIFMDELVHGTKRTTHKRNINGLRAFLERLDRNSKSGDKLFRTGDRLNIRALCAIIQAWNAFPQPPETYTWDDDESLTPKVQQ